MRPLTPFLRPPGWLGSLLLPAFLLLPFAAQAQTVTGELFIDATQGGFGGSLAPDDFFGAAVSALGDLDGDGVGDYAVGAPGTDGDGANTGAVWILFMNDDGTVKAERKLDATTEALLDNLLAAEDEFGLALAALDGAAGFTLAVGAPGDDDGGQARGAVWLLTLGRDGGITNAVKHSAATTALAGLTDADLFGRGIALLGDLGNDGTVELAVGVPGADSDTLDTGAVYILSLSAGGVVAGVQVLSKESGLAAGGGLPGLAAYDGFGFGVAGLGDLNGDGTPDLVAGSPFAEPNGGANRGRLHVLFLNSDGEVTGTATIEDAAASPLENNLTDEGFFGYALGTPRAGSLFPATLMAGAPGTDTNPEAAGALWGFVLDQAGGILQAERIADAGDGLTLPAAGDGLGFGLAVPGAAPGYELANTDVAVGAPFVEAGDDNDGSLRLLTISDDVLPVELTAFEAVLDEQAVVLTWATASETNNAGFEVQHRPAGEDVGAWQRLAFVEGHGTTVEAKSYQYRHEGLGLGRHQFRLQQVDFDGSTAFSEMVEVALQLIGAYQLNAYPNPFQDGFSLQVAVAQAQHVQVAVYDVLGRRVALLHEGRLEADRAYRFEVDAQRLPAGSYFVRVAGERLRATRHLTSVR